jgi:tetratricopeptide (TPR) repeat protein
VCGLLVCALALGGCGSGGKRTPAPAAAIAEPASSPKDGPAAAATPAPGRRLAALLNGMGSTHHPISTKVPEAQTYFNQGLVLAYAFNHAEAHRSFLEATRLDPECAMCFWGAAWVLGPNYNRPMLPDAAPQAWALSQKALALKDKATPREQAYVTALTRRYAEQPPANRTPLDQAFSDAMLEVAKAFPDDLDAQVIAADTLMVLHPWDMYDLRTRKRRPWTGEILARLEAVLARKPDHPGANHLFIHTVESTEPRLAIPHADRLGTLVPGAGHLVHMPSHIYMRVGRFADASEANERAIKADQEYFETCHAQGIYQVVYYPHNWHFLWFTYTYQGRRAKAIEAAKHVGDGVPHELMGNCGMGLMDHFVMVPMFAYARFGMFSELLAIPRPKGDFEYQTAAWHYGRIYALIFTGELDKATAELEALRKYVEANEEVLMRTKVKAATYDLIQVGIHLLKGELAAKRGDYKGAIAALRHASYLEDGLLYYEPPAWFYPVRHALGAVYLEAKQPKLAEAVYVADLELFPENPFSLFGLHKALLAQGKNKAALAVGERFEKAWSQADYTLTSSRY